ncbi:MAG: MBL fold metallo-hydrolase [Candidatus Hermodarchaeota archaeon]
MMQLQIPNLNIINLPENILLVHQIKPPHYFSCCDGLIILPKEGRNEQTIVVDLNIEPVLIDKLYPYITPVSMYICSHGHMDHITHVHKWESLGAQIFAPEPEHSYLLDLANFYTGYGFDQALSFETIEQFAIVNMFKPCNSVNSFKPGHKFQYNSLWIETIPFLGHSKAHVGFLISRERILHISCLGYDLMFPESDGFGPWYGFKECSLDQYLKDISMAKQIFLHQSDVLTSSHSNIVNNPDITPFTYMRNKIQSNQVKVNQAIKTLNINGFSNESLQELLKLDLFFPKSKMKGFMKEIYNFWESGIIEKHFKKQDNASK